MSDPEFAEEIVGKDVMENFLESMLEGLSRVKNFVHDFAMRMFGGIDGKEEGGGDDLEDKSMLAGLAVLCVLVVSLVLFRRA